MLSVLIPIFNIDCNSLVNELEKQLLATGINFEIICMDDCSSSSFREKNSILKNKINVNYIELEKNIGRSKIRNMLANEAKFDYLLFMDCDSKVISENYISSYLNSLHPNKILYGGRIYQEHKPSEKNLKLHWIYGTKREAKNAEERSKNSHQNFMTNNFLIPKTIFNQIRFDENITEYGHEDTLFGLQLRNAGIIIDHINNPLLHDGIEDSSVFISKTEHGLKNLKHLYLYKLISENDVKLLSYYQLVSAFWLTGIVGFLFKIFRKIIIKNLRSNSPSLVLFDLYKLGYFCFLCNSK